MLFCAKTSINKFYVFAIALLLTVTLAGCGGGSGSSSGATDPPVTTPDPGTTPDPALQMAADAAQSAADAAQMAADDTSTHMAAAEHKAAADAAAAEAIAAAAAAQAAADAGNLETAQAEQAKAESARDAARMAMADGVMAEADAVAAEMTAMQVAATAAAATKRTAIGAEAAQAADAGLGGSGVSTYTMTIERDEDGTTVAIVQTDMNSDDDPKYMQTMDLGGGLTMHVRDSGMGVNEVVMVKTDIEAPKNTAFTMVHSLNANPNDATPPVNQSLGVESSNFALLETDGITSTGAGTITLPNMVEDNEGTPEDETVAAFETAATFDGAPGILKCARSGSNCTVTLDAAGEITAVSGGWIFTPADGAMVKIADADYLHYGFWLKKTTDSDGATTYDEVETFAGSSIAATGSLANVTGSATYAGGAVGVYVREVYKTEDASIDTATSGHFTADVSLTATFAQEPVSDTDSTGTIAPSLLNTLAGTINNFQLAGGEANGWSVALQGDIQTSNGTASGAANGGGAAGAFTAAFHGPRTDSDSEVIQPHSVAGEFNANFGNGTVAGAFGARKE